MTIINQISKAAKIILVIAIAMILYGYLSRAAGIYFFLGKS